jgi:hypothetical protein
MITIDIEAKDFVEAADHQRKLEEMVRAVKREYESAALLLRERRERAAVRPAPPLDRPVPYARFARQA